MTIVIGMLAQNGNEPPSSVVLGADSEESNWIYKSSVQKIATVQKPGCKCLIGGSGSGTFIDMAVQEFERRTLSNPTSLDEVRETLESVVTDIYQKRIRKFSPKDRTHYGFTLLCGISVKGEGVQLIEVDNASSLIRTTPRCIGSGDYLASYLLSTYALAQLTSYQASRLAVYVLSQVKQFATSCGGLSHIHVLKDDGSTHVMFPEFIAQHEQATTTVISTGAKLLLNFVDPVGEIGKTLQLEEAIDKVSTLLREDLRRHWPLDTAPTEATSAGPSPSIPSVSAQPPSPESDESHQPPS